MIRVTRRDWVKARRVPSELEAAQTKLAVEAQEAWVAAREACDYAAFQPWLDRTLELKRQYAECFAPYDDPYDALLDDFEPGVATAEVREVFETLERELVPLIAEVGSTSPTSSCAARSRSTRQREVSLAIVERMGYTPESFRLDEAVHPFSSNSGTRDIRLTSRYDEST